MKKILFFLWVALSAVSVAGRITIPVDSYIAIGLNYGDEGVPQPMRGDWFKFFFKPMDDQQEALINVVWEKVGGDSYSVVFEFVSAAGVSRFKEVVNIGDWSNGYLDDEGRVKAWKEKTLLHFDKKVMRVNGGLLSDDVSIMKHVLGRRGGEDVSIVVYKAKKVSDLIFWFKMVEHDKWNLGGREWFESAN